MQIYILGFRFHWIITFSIIYSPVTVLHPSSLFTEVWEKRFKFCDVIPTVDFTFNILAEHCMTINYTNGKCVLEDVSASHEHCKLCRFWDKVNYCHQIEDWNKTIDQCIQKHGDHSCKEECNGCECVNGVKTCTKHAISPYISIILLGVWSTAELEEWYA